jgi:GTPase SAR1 family protein
MCASDFSAAGESEIYITVLIETIGSFWKFPGFNVETVEYKNISFTVWDVGGQDKVKKLSFEIYCQMTCISNGLAIVQCFVNIFCVIKIHIVCYSALYAFTLILLT